MESESPYRIDVYVDGCWLTKGKSNPKEGGGFGILVIESKNGEEVERWAHSGQYADDTLKIKGAEREAILKGLEAVIIRQKYWEDKLATAHVILHTDQKDFAEKFSKENRSSISKNKDSYFDKIAHATQTLTDMGMSVEIKYTKAKKARNSDVDGERMDIAHDLAHGPALRLRLERQGYLGRASSEAIAVGTAAQRIIDEENNIDLRKDKNSLGR